MKVALVVCMALLAVLLQAADKMSPPIRRAGTRIHHGTPAKPQQFPYMAYILSTDDSGKKSIECGGSVITRVAVLTAGSCVHGYTKYTVRLGTIYRTANDTNAWTVVTKLALVHPKYNSSNYDNNIAIIHLPTEAPLNDFIQPVNLPCSPVVSSYVGSSGIVSGWGETYSGSGISDVLLWAEVVVIPNDYCKKFFYATAITDRSLCASSVSSTVWNYDWGGPLVIKTRELYVQIGIFSRFSWYGYNNSIPATYTRVTSFIDWIKLKTESE